MSADIGPQLIIPAELFISARAKKLHAFVKEIDTEGEAAHTAPAGHGGAGPIRDRTTNERRAVRQHDQQDHQQKCHLAVPLTAFSSFACQSGKVGDRKFGGVSRQNATFWALKVLSVFSETSPIALKQTQINRCYCPGRAQVRIPSPHDRACVRLTETQLFLRNNRRGRWPVFHRRRCGPVADPGRTIKPARPVVGVALRWRSFFLAGVAIAIQTLCPNAIGELPADAPRWLRLVQYLIAVAIFCCFGAIASWIAFGPGERQFSGTIMTGNATIDAAIGRTAFGVGAVIIWLCTAESSIRAQRAPASSGRQIVRSAKQCCYAKVSCAGLTRRDAAALSL